MGKQYKSEYEWDGRNGVARHGRWWTCPDDEDGLKFTDKELAILHAREVRRRQPNGQIRENVERALLLLRPLQIIGLETDIRNALKRYEQKQLAKQQ